MKAAYSLSNCNKTGGEVECSLESGSERLEGSKFNKNKNLS